ncbi:xanthine dehydrogenase family protein molybdopterin-binding subunit [Teichococcus vastitatis]|uniref:Molybdopterin-dependent oxidoreductase n=1 Tax=Teichococcus vastitatis TaxID=2307076 RepID=A0ABS9W6Z2_9PROT|nr:molybdopterin cofactor-binding domain-containing protein [Pseudoroseomonas vastitatis]MCI0754993.1 molybdopterin-dependent oxidoreductase [Pseudoroseomonas vastitatis]
MRVRSEHGAVLSRRSVLAGTGALVLSFSLGDAAAAPEGQPRLPGSLQTNPGLNAWIRVDAQGAVTVFTGKAELGQGIRTALLQVAAEELEVQPARVTLVTADTERTPNEGYTAGSHSLQDSGTAIRHAAAQVREILVEEAARRWNLDPTTCRAENAMVLGPGGRRLDYGALVAAEALSHRAQPESSLKDPARFTVMNTSLPRLDIPAKVTGGAAYVQDMRPEGMVHARVVRPPAPGATLLALDSASVERMPGVLAVVRNGSFLAVVAGKEWQAIKAMRALSADAQWQLGPLLPKQEEIFDTLRSLPSQNITILDNRRSVEGARRLHARFTRAYQAHGSIGPSCALAQWVDGAVTVWTHTQGVYPDRAAIAEMLRLPLEKVRLVHAEGSGCYGHNGADDAAADAALIARAVPGRPVRLQWMREQENAWEPLSPGMVTEIEAGLDASGRIVDWDYGVWSCSHNTRPGPAGALLPARLLAEPFPIPEPKASPQPEGAGDRNGIPLYHLPSARVVHHFLRDMPLRTSAMRSLGAYMNVFSIESFMDELAKAAGADPVEFRLRHMEDARARDVIALAAERFSWRAGQRAPRGRGYGFGFARYKNLAAYCAVAVELEVEHETGRVRLLRAVAAVDSGQVVNPDGLRNQVEGAVLQSASWTLYESVTFNQQGITSVDWSSYPILRFAAVPDSVEVHLVERPGYPFLGAGETGQGPAAAAIGNALADATGRRLRNLPLTRERVKAAIGV